MAAYTACLRDAGGATERCKHLSKRYLECRMSKCVCHALTVAVFLLRLLRGAVWAKVTPAWAVPADSWCSRTLHSWALTRCGPSQRRRRWSPGLCVVSTSLWPPCLTHRVRHLQDLKTAPPAAPTPTVRQMGSLDSESCPRSQFDAPSLGRQHPLRRNWLRSAKPGLWRACAPSRHGQQHDLRDRMASCDDMGCVPKQASLRIAPSVTPLMLGTELRQAQERLAREQAARAEAVKRRLEAERRETERQVSTQHAARAPPTVSLFFYLPLQRAQGARGPGGGAEEAPACGS
jgi:hypothetical protein